MKKHLICTFKPKLSNNRWCILLFDKLYRFYLFCILIIKLWSSSLPKRSLRLISCARTCKIEKINSLFCIKTLIHRLLLFLLLEFWIFFQKFCQEEMFLKFLYYWLSTLNILWVLLIIFFTPTYWQIYRTMLKEFLCNAYKKSINKRNHSSFFIEITVFINIL